MSTSPTAATLVVLRAATALVVPTGVDARDAACLLTSVDGGTGLVVRMETGEELVVPPEALDQETPPVPTGEGAGPSPNDEASQVTNGTQTATTPGQAA